MIKDLYHEYITRNSIIMQYLVFKVSKVVHKSLISKENHIGVFQFIKKLHILIC